MAKTKTTYAAYFRKKDVALTQEIDALCNQMQVSVSDLMRAAIRLSLHQHRNELIQEILK